MAKLPYMQFYTADWLLDTQPLTPATRGVWVDILCLMWRAPERKGVLQYSAKEWCAILRCPDAEFRAAITEFKMWNTCKVTESGEDIKILCRRINKEYRERENNAGYQRSFRERGGGDPERWSAIRVHVLERDKYICGYCAKKARTVDHVIPRSKGGSHDYSNLVACCRSCNIRKYNRTLEECGFALLDSHKLAIRPPSDLHKPENQNQNQSHISESESEVREEKKEERKKKSSGQVKTLPGIPKSAFVWQAYSEAYQGRYGIEPVRNRQTNALLCLLVDKLGEQEAPLVASFYLSHNNPFYVAKRHPPNLLLQDAEGLRTQWATGVKSTTSEVKHAEFKDNLMGKIARVEQILSERRQA